MKKIAVLGDPNSIWIQTYVKEVLSSSYFDEVVIFSDRIFNYDEKQYPQNVRIRYCLGNKVSYICSLLTGFLSEGKFEYIHIHYINLRKLLGASLVKWRSRHTIATFWGSDLLGKGSGELKSFTKYLHKIDCVTVGSKDMSEYFKNVYSEELTKKMKVVRFGVSGLEPIYNMTIPYEKLRDKWGIAPNKYVITVGYNGSKRQNHANVIEQLKMIPSDLAERCFLIFPMTYGVSGDYIDEIKKLLSSSGYNYRILTDFMDYDTVAELCCLSDVFIHAQDTDAFSASVQEYLCAGKLLMNPNWIIYDELKNNNVYYWEYESYTELKQLIIHYLSDGLSKDEKAKIQANREKMYRMSSWQYIKNDWQALYDETGM